MIANQRTIGSEVTFSGVGLHGGEQTTVVFKPAPPNSGIKFIRTDVPERPEIRADVANASESDHSRRTVLRKGDVTISTVEHVLAAVHGLAIDNLTIELNRPEPAEPDGSSAPYVEILKRAGLVDQPDPKRYLEVKSPVGFSENGVEIMALPFDGLRITFTVHYDHPQIGTQYASFDISEDVFEKEIAPARTFSLLKEVEELRKRGLIKGGSLKNSIVVSDDGIRNEEPLRFPDEFVRHKILDLLGDLCLVGGPIKAHVIAVRSGHTTNIKLVRLLKSQFGEQPRGLVGKRVREVPSSLSIEEIEEIMPHRYPFLLVDRILLLEEGKRVVGLKNVTINEPFFAGHFPGHPIMPAVLIIEAMAQVGGVLLLSMVENPKTKLVYFMAIDKAKFRKPVFPGDQVKFDLEMVKLKMNTCKMKGKAYVGNDLVAEAELLSMLVDRQNPPEKGGIL
ncbi:MAG: bifunctional UDP-3-O-[3-hydroxymyristoyl] N-acetylglucosamine deacetylase/3-hydroxyacyl-ACP dehydratase [Candidatus Eisenbacteria bacterium]|jgi:UDP-3-O-[3-hydroxymyristoyl] N-acetylglucosamine deacetylase/3-hydroxyacyl-[acyl-carrier-protein] dehydratase